VNDATSSVPQIDVEYLQEKDPWEILRQYGNFRRDQALAEVRFWERVLEMDPTKTARELKKERRADVN